MYKRQLLYNAAYVYQYRLNNVPKAKQLLIQFLKTRPKESKENKQEKTPQALLEEPEVYEEDAPTDNLTKKYDAAEYWLKSILKQEKQEKFFKGELEEEK